MYQSLSGDSLDNADDNDFIAMFDHAHHKDVPISFDNSMRDGYFEEDQMFLVWSDNDKFNMVKFLGVPK